MNTTIEELVLDYYELHLIRKALVRMTHSSDLDSEDLQTLERLAHQLADAKEVLLKHVPRY
jgi:hypothetical protein